MKKLVLFSPVTMLTTYNSYEQKRNIGAAVELDIQSMIKPIQAKVKFMINTAYTWCGTRGHSYHVQITLKYIHQ